MKRGWWYRLLFLLFLTVVSVMSVIPTVFKLPDSSTFPVKSKVNLGLDLQGGLYMILGIDFKKVYRDETKNTIRKIIYVLGDEGIKANLGDMDISDPEDPKHSLTLEDPSKVSNAKKLIKDYFQNIVRLTKQDGGVLEYGLSGIRKVQIQDQSVTKSIEVIRNRIDEFGVSEPEIISQGKDRIIVQLPGVKNIDRAKALIGKTAKLEFKLVNDEIAASTLEEWVTRAKDKGIKYEKGTRYSDFIVHINEFLKKDIPDGYELVFKKNVNKFTNDIESMVPFLVESGSNLTGEDLQDAAVQIDQQNNQPYVSLNFKSSGANRFEEITGNNTGKRLAIILDGNVYTAPGIKNRIGGGRARIDLGAVNYNDALEQGKDIALVLRAGALPVQLDFEEQRIVGPSLGSDSIKSAKLASLIGCGLIFLFILIYYRISGAIAIVTLVLNALMVMACLAGFGATLTLPGIAGIALTIGMAVDANIIIYERIREEKRRGATNLKSVKEGFDSAFWTILDANITTALAGFCLLNFGTGPIRGFAVTLLIGIMATVYTAYFVSRILFDFYMDKVSGKDLSI